VMPTIMIVDDNPAVVDAFIMMLEKRGYPTLAAYSGEECCEALETGKVPDLILLDVMMEPTDGWETLRRIRSDPRTRDIPVVMLTAKQISVREALEYSNDMDSYVLKPITRSRLYDAVDLPLNRRAAIEREVGMARGSGADQEMIDEYIHIRRRVDVLHQLQDIFETLYTNNPAPDGRADAIISDLEEFRENVKVQEERLSSLMESLNIS